MVGFGLAGKVSSVSVCYGLMRYGWISFERGGERYGVRLETEYACKSTSGGGIS